MVFSSEIFLFLFLPFTLLGYYLLPKKIKNYWLLFCSLFFYGWNNFSFLGLLLFNIGINYLFARLIDNSKMTSEKKTLLICSIILNLIGLYVFKYFDFSITLINQIFKSDFSLLELILPVGISFYTFQGMSYVIDVYRGDVKVQKNIFLLALYVSLFPQLVAGPIVRYKDIEASMCNRSTSVEDMAQGIKRFIIGLSKKIILADNAAIVVDSIWNLPSTDLTSGIAWVGIIFYAFQIYFDFSGYSDMAIGLGKIFGFTFLENFNFPYIASSITDFWRRWHISLSSWFKDYIYIPLGGNRKHLIRNLLIVFLLTGIWHGAGLTFIIWGLWNGIFNILEKIIGITKDETITWWKKVLRHIYVLSVVLIGWLFFKATSLEQALIYIKAMFTDSVAVNPSFGLGWFLNKYNIFIGILCLIFSTPLPNKLYFKITKGQKTFEFKILEYIVLLFLLLYSIMQLVSSNFHPFIYFQF